MRQRRQFLGAGAAGILAAGAAPAGALAFAAAPPAGVRPKFRLIGGKAVLMDLTEEIFAPLVGTKFAAARAADGVQAAAGADLALARVAKLEDSPERIQFSLRFEGPAEPALPQGIYLFSHPGIGRFDLFIVPVGRTERGRQYEAAFNRRKAKP